jgi:SAM-dependent methyltransferase
VIPAPARAVGRGAYHAVMDALDLWRGHLTPPRRLIFVGPGDYRKTGEEFLGYFRSLGRLAPTDRVLDLGCGIGRMAVPLTRYLTTGSYEGIDIVSEGIEWCQANISRRFPHFRFRCADVFNRRYNPGGTVKASEYRFPFESASFDFVFLTSVFTHMLPEDVRHYLSEIRRVLRPDCRCLMTFFLLNDHAREAIRGGHTHRRFEHQGEGYSYDIEKVHEGAVAYEDVDVLAYLREAGFELHVPIVYGRWAGRPAEPFGQDIVVVR